MIRIKYIGVLMVVLATLNPVARSQTEKSVNDLCYEGYTKGEVELWEQALSLATDIHQKQETDSSLHQLILVQYGFTAYCISEKLKTRGDEILTEAYKNTNYLMEKDPENAEYIALKAAFLAFELNLHPLRMNRIIKSSMELTDLAYQKDSSLIMSLSCKANMMNFTPKIFGGNPEKAIPLYYKIIELFENKRVTYINDWRYINTMVILADTYSKMKMHAEACKIYEKIIAHDSNIGWINNNLYPECRSKLENN